MTKSEMLLPPRNDSFSWAGDGARVLAATLRKLPELSVRRRLCGKMGVGDGDSIGAMETRPAMRDTRCLEERRRGRGDDGERDGGVGRMELREAELRLEVKGFGDTVLDGEVMKEEVIRGAEGMREESEIGVKLRGRMIGDESMNA